MPYVWMERYAGGEPSSYSVWHWLASTSPPTCTSDSRTVKYHIAIAAATNSAAGDGEGKESESPSHSNRNELVGQLHPGGSPTARG